MKPKSKAIAKSFKATLERMEGNLGWVIIRIPFNVEKVWGARGRLRMMAALDAAARVRRARGSIRV